MPNILTAEQMRLLKKLYYNYNNSNKLIFVDTLCAILFVIHSILWLLLKIYWVSIINVTVTLIIISNITLIILGNKYFKMIYLFSNKDIATIERIIMMKDDKKVNMIGSNRIYYIIYSQLIIVSVLALIGIYCKEYYVTSFIYLCVMIYIIVIQEKIIKREYMALVHNLYILIEELNENKNNNCYGNSNSGEDT